ncbi:MAG: hypothetical protein J2P34_01570 [Actinobacteria bacterium]|nr:hypothetical protein [Actinomycetota bacterium]
MSEMFRHCGECGEEQLFEQPHAAPGSCPDTPDGECAEWACTGCGAALLAGLVLAPAGARYQARPRGRVA